MHNPEFPYRPLLEELTVVADQAGLDPYEGYAWLYEHQLAAGLRPSVYCSTSITSGGHARDDSLTMRAVIERNTTSARLLAEQLAHDGQIRPESTIEPVFVGKTHWSQVEYMEFWLSVLGGFELTKGFIARDVDGLRKAATQEFSNVDLDMGLMASQVPPSERAIEYFRMSKAFANLVETRTNARPMETVVRMVDTDLSLGAQTERAFARLVGARVMNIVVIQPARVADLAKVNTALAVDTERLISFGATVFDTTERSVQLLLTEESAL